MLWIYMFNFLCNKKNVYLLYMIVISFLISHFSPA